MNIGRPTKRLSICAIAVAGLWLATPDTAHAVSEPTFRQSITGEGGSPLSVVLSAAPIQNNLLVAIFTTRTIGTMTGPSGWSIAVVSDGSSPSMGIYYKVAGASESSTVTVSTTASGSANALTVLEFSGTATSSVLDGVDAAGGSSNTPSSGTASTVYKNGIIVAGLVTKAGNSFSSPTNNFIEQHDFVVGGGGSSTLNGVFYRRHTGNNNSVAATSTGNDAWRGAIAAFKSSAPTAVTITSFRATRDGTGRVQLAWTTGAEIDNLGFHLYRDSGGTRTQLTPWPIAGSALTVGPRTMLPAGQAYHWDTAETAADGGAATYHLEAIDLRGEHTWYGPIVADEGAIAADADSPLLTAAVTPRPSAGTPRVLTPAAHDTAAEAARPSALQRQRQVAAQPAVKLLVDTPGWQRVSIAALHSVGLPPADPRTLRVFLDGVEQPVKVAGGALEFYGTPADTPWTGQQVYWVVSGGPPGRRIPVRPARRVLRRSAGLSFPATVERRDRAIFFAALQNGEAANWFGALVTPASPTALDLPVTELAALDGATATLEVTLQGVSGDSAVPRDHTVTVALNDTPLGELRFDGQAAAVRRFVVDAALLHEGANTVTLQGHQTVDVSLVDTLRLTYPHRYRPDGDQLWATAPGAARLTLSGWEQAAVRLIDVTKPALPVEWTLAPGTLDGDGYAVAFDVPAGGTRRLLAFTDAAVQTPTLVFNTPSAWHATRADYLLLTHPSLADAVAPLAAHRAGQGHTVATIDVTDLYDEFSYGRKTPQALTDFLRATARGRLRYVTLVGDASSDPRNYAGLGDADLVPTRFVPMKTVALEAASDEALAPLDARGLAIQTLIGRLPARTPAQVTTMVAKLLAADTAPPTPTVLLTADGADADYDFTALSDTLRPLLPSTWPQTAAYVDTLGPDGAHTATLARLADPPWLVTYVGHGATTSWGQTTDLLTTPEVAALSGPPTTLVVALTCLTGFFTTIYPPEAGLAEAFLRAPGGAAAVWASSSLTTAPGQLAAARRLVTALAAGDTRTLGQAVRAARAATADPDVRASWILFGDPALRLPQD